MSEDFWEQMKPSNLGTAYRDILQWLDENPNHPTLRQRNVEIFKLRYMAGMKLKDIAAEYHISPERVRKIIQHTEARILRNMEDLSTGFDDDIELPTFKLDYVVTSVMRHAANEEQMEQVIHILKKPVTALKASTLLTNRLMGNYIYFIGDIVRFSPKELLKLRGFGKTCLAELQPLLADLNLRLRSA